MQFACVVCRQECILQEVLCCCRTLEGRMRRVELALDIPIDSGLSHVQSLEVPTASCQAAVHRSQWTEGAPSTNIPAVYETTSDKYLQEPLQTLAQYHSPSGAVGEAAAHHSDSEPHDQSARDQPKPQQGPNKDIRVWHGLFTCR